MLDIRSVCGLIDLSTRIPSAPFTNMYEAHNKPGIFDSPVRPKDGVMESMEQTMDQIAANWDETMAATWGSTSIFTVGRRQETEAGQQAALLAGLDANTTRNLYPSDDARIAINRVADENFAKLPGMRAA